MVAWIQVRAARSRAHAACSFKSLAFRASAGGPLPPGASQPARLRPVAGTHRLLFTRSLAPHCPPLAAQPLAALPNRPSPPPSSPPSCPPTWRSTSAPSSSPPAPPRATRPPAPSPRAASTQPPTATSAAAPPRCATRWTSASRAWAARCPASTPPAASRTPRPLTRARPTASPWARPCPHVSGGDTGGRGALAWGGARISLGGARGGCVLQAARRSPPGSPGPGSGGRAWPSWTVSQQ